MFDWKDSDLPITYTYKYMLDDGTGFKHPFGDPCKNFFYFFNIKYLTVTNFFLFFSILGEIEDKLETMCQEVPLSSSGFMNGSNFTLALPAGQIIVVGYVQDGYGAKTRW